METDLIEHQLYSNIPSNPTAPDLFVYPSTLSPSISKPLGAIASFKGIWRGFRQEKVAFVLTSIYLIFEYLRPHLIYPEFDIVPWGKIILSFAIFAAFFDPISERPPTAAVISMSALSICVLLSMAFAFSTSIAVREWVYFFNWVIVVFLFTSVVSTRTRLFLFISVYFFCNLKMAQHGFRSWAFGGFGFSGWGVTGSPGWFQNSGEFSMEMAVFLPLVLSYIVTFRGDWSLGTRFFFYLLIIMTVGSIIGCSNRGGILGLITVGLWLLVFSRKRIKAIVVLAVSATIIYMVIPQKFEKLETTGEDSTSISRLKYWEIGKEAINKNPVTGIGFKNWTVWVEVMHPEFIGFIGGPDKIEVIHNTFLEAATELGLLGASVYALILMEIFFINLRSVRKARQRKDRFLEATSVGLIGSLFAYIVSGCFMSVLYYPYIWVLLAFTLSVSSVRRKDGREKLMIT